MTNDGGGLVSHLKNRSINWLLYAHKSDLLIWVFLWILEDLGVGVSRNGNCGGMGLAV